MKTLSVKVPSALEVELTVAATRRGLSKSALIRAALEGALTSGRGRQAGSFLALARDLAGCVAGPKDLSHSPRHLRDYGR